MIQFAGVVVILVWVAFFSSVIFKIISFMGLLRIEEDQEKVGYDTAEFSPAAAYKGNAG
jgi:ammonia channel protein AmtB